MHIVTTRVPYQRLVLFHELLAIVAIHSDQPLVHLVDDRCAYIVLKQIPYLDWLLRDLLNGTVKGVQIALLLDHLTIPICHYERHFLVDES